MKALTFAPQPAPEVRRPTVAQPAPPSLIFYGWGPRLSS
jgi:hypothetical protein